MNPRLCSALPCRAFLAGLLLCLFLLLPLEIAWATSGIVLTFANADLQTVIKKVSEFTGRVFLFDPEQVHGKITLEAGAEEESWGVGRG
ncbi:MAG TPA: hypothetical protein VKJ47_10960 [Candidatus Binatia bacterium]|nr:hypothetical protein [Candidatus Binatia bacterium]